MSDHPSAGETGVTSDERIRNALRRHIQRAYDRRDFTRHSLAEESGVSLHSIDQIVSRDPAKQRRVTCEDAFNIAYTLGDGAVSALVGTMHYIAARRDTGAVEATRLVANILPHMSVIAEAASDGRIDHLEAPDCRDAADKIINLITPLSSAGGAA